VGFHEIGVHAVKHVSNVFHVKQQRGVVDAEHLLR
jgi:hypothetical protein